MILTENDLMIGDWVWYDPNVFIEDEYEPRKDIVPIRIENAEDIDSAIEDCYGAMRITTQLLRQNDFEFSVSVPGDEYAILNINDNCHIKYSFATNMCYIKNDVSEAAVKILYFHELQHLAKLFKIEKVFYGGTD